MLNVRRWWHRYPRFMLFGLSEKETSWRGVGLLAAVFLGSLLIAAVLTPPAYWLVEWWRDRTGSETAQWLLDKGVDTYFDRLRMASVILGLPWLMSKCHLWSWRALGLAPEKNNMRRGVYGWIAGLAMILGLALWEGAHAAVNEGGLSIMKVCLTALLAGLILGFLEEVVFRG